MQLATEYAKQEPGFGLLLLAPPKVGKTTFCCRFPKPYFADCDNNLGGALRFIGQHDPERLKNIRYDIINNTQDGRTVPEEDRWLRLLACCDMAIKEPEIRTVIADSLSSISDYVQDYIVHLKPNTKEKYMTISDWTPFRAFISRFVVQMRSKRKLFVMTAHEEINKNELTGGLVITPNMPSKLAHNIGGFFSDVWRCEVHGDEKNPLYRVRVSPRPEVPSLGNSLLLAPGVYNFTSEQLTQLLDKATPA